MENHLKILIIEDNPADFLLVERRLRADGVEAGCARVESMAELESCLAASSDASALADGNWDIVLADYALPEMTFEEALACVRDRQPDLPVILVTGALGEEKAVDLLKQGCSDVVLKGNLVRLAPAIRRSLSAVAETKARKAAERGLARANRALRTLSAVNLALVRATDEDELLHAVTRIIVESGGYNLAAIYFAVDDPELSIMLMAWYCSQNKSSASCLTLSDHIARHPTWADTESGQTPVGLALRNGVSQICRNIEAHIGFSPWRDAALSCGFTANIVLPLSYGDLILGGVCIYSSEPEAFDDQEVSLLKELADDLAYGVNTIRTRAERDQEIREHEWAAEALRISLEQTVQVIADTVEARDVCTAGHQRRVAKLAVAIAEEMGLPKEQIHGLRLAAAIHDLGKLRVPAEILSRPGCLSDVETLLVKTHPQAGYDILKEVSFPWPIAEIVWQHHEKLNGSGYPRGLKGDQILLEARILTIADVVEAISSHRPYRPTLGLSAAMKEINENRGVTYDAGAVDACLKLISQGRFVF